MLATGTRNRPLLVPGHDLAGVHALRTHAEAEALRVGIQVAEAVVVVGAGFLGLEAAAVAAARGARVEVVEATRLPMGRAVSAVVSEAFTRQHRRQGIRFHLGTSVVRLHGETSVTGVELADGTVLPASLVLVCIGVIPNAELAAEAGLAVANGIVVDELLATADPAISAIGDCAAYPNRYAGGRVRLESVQNAVDHARCLAARLLGRAAPYHAVPWFWSDQGDWKLQIAGFAAGCDTFVPRGDTDGRDFTVFAFRDGRLAGVETVEPPGRPYRRPPPAGGRGHDHAGDGRSPGLRSAADGQGGAKLIAVRPLAAADLDRVVALWVAAWDATMPGIDFAARAGWLRERLARHAAAGVQVVCAAVGDEPVGFVTVDPATGHVDQLAVDPRRSGQGVGSALIAAARAAAAAPLALEVNQENPRAVRFYEREGLRITGAGTIGANKRPTWTMSDASRPDTGCPGGRD